MSKLALALCTLAAAALACRSAREPVAQRAAALTVACDFQNPPFALRDRDGRPAGRDVEMVEQLGRVIGREVRWVELPFGELLDACAAGRVDAVCATLGVTPERAQRVRFTRPYYATSIRVLVRAGEGAPGSLADLGGRAVRASVGTTAERAVRERLRTTRLVPAGDPAAGLLAGDFAGAAMDAHEARELARRSGGALTVLAEPLAPERYAIAVAPGRDALLGELDLGLAALAETGALARLDARHGLPTGDPPAASTAGR